ncbi:MAG: serine/threonine protein kinase [Brevundimonas sp.]|nr:MAG: serine/threonine protein kinase [Brevundimonas sp.]
MSLYAVYALILFAVPTLGASAALALLAVTGREGPGDPVAGTHFIFQQRTLWTGAVVALLGLILIVINVGVFVLFVVALWLMARGVWGVLRLKAGQPIPNPRGWLF